MKGYTFFSILISLQRQIVGHIQKYKYHDKRQDACTEEETAGSNLFFCIPSHKYNPHFHTAESRCRPPLMRRRPYSAERTDKVIRLDYINISSCFPILGSEYITDLDYHTGTCRSKTSTWAVRGVPLKERKTRSGTQFTESSFNFIAAYGDRVSHTRTRLPPHHGTN